ncbi:MAG: FCD domain-containing protein [Marinovum sp.]|nr:FCD domain-containing protein [Marinovum sp.]
MQRQSLASHIATELAADVHNGALREGEMYPSERDLCERFGVGRSIVRDGMTILQGMGLTGHIKGKRPRVTEPTLAGVMSSVSDAAQYFFKDMEGRAHLQQARLFLETSMVQYAVENASNAQIAKMAVTVEECDASLTDITKFRGADVKFHRALAEVPGNPIFVALHEAFVDRLMRNAPIKANSKEHNTASNEGHKKIISAILARDTDAAVKSLTAHLVRNYEVFLPGSISRGKEESS